LNQNHTNPKENKPGKGVPYNSAAGSLCGIPYHLARTEGVFHHRYTFLTKRFPNKPFGLIRIMSMIRIKEISPAHLGDQIAE
jgi:hypothetical protein